MRKAALSFYLIPVLILAQVCTITNAQITYPSPSWDYSPTTPRVGDIVTFDASDFEKTWNERGESIIASLVWDFGDGASANGALVTHTFTSPGTFLAGVRATDNRGYGGTSQFEIEVRKQTPITVYLSLGNGEIYTGQEVTLRGSLTHNGAGVPDEWIVLSSKTYIEGAIWSEIATVKTDARGEYSAVWKPTYGYYQVKAAWTGTSSYPETRISVILIVKGFGDFITDFSSNSTVSGLYFNSTMRLLTFSAQGPSGTNGYVNITFERDASFNPESISVLFDGHQIDYEVDPHSQSWILLFTYPHSIHNIVVNFNANENATPSSFPLEALYAMAVIGAIAIAVVFFIYFKKRKRQAAVTANS